MPMVRRIAKRPQTPSIAVPQEAVGSVPLLWVGFLIWMFSGSPTITSTSNYVAFQVIGVLIEFVICFPRLKYLARLRPFVIVGMLYVAWFGLSILGGLSNQLLGLLGQLLKIGMVALLFAATPKPIEALVESMLIISTIALPIFAVRHVLLFFGVDLADYFTPLYSLAGATSERSIIVFNFHTVQDAYRNSGPFREPGLFAANLVIATILLLSPAAEYSRTQRLRRITVFGAALLTTGSTMGILAMVPLGVLALSRLERIYVKKFAILGVAIVASAVFFLASDTGHLEKIERQLMSTEMQSNTWYQSRFGNAYVDYIAVLDRPFLGYGFAETGRPILWDTRIQMQYVGEANIGFGNGFSGTFVKFGIPCTLALYLFFSLRLLSLAGGRLAGLMSMIAFFVVLFGQQVLLMPAVYALCIGRDPQARRGPSKGAAVSRPRLRRSARFA